MTKNYSIGTKLTTDLCQMNLQRMKEAQLTIKFIVLVGGLIVSLFCYVRGNCFVALNTLIAKLEDRIKKSEVKGAKRTGFLRYERKNAEFSHCDPPDGPLWAIALSNAPTGIIVFLRHLIV